MGLFERIFGKRPAVANAGEYKELTVYSPAFRTYSGRIYESDLVRSAIHAKATHISKLKVEFYGHGSEAVMQRLKKPNALQTWSQFLYRLATIYEAENTAFVVPVRDKYGRIVEVYPAMPSNVKLVSVNDEPWVAFQFSEWRFAQAPVWEIGTMAKFQYKHDLFGESNAAMMPTMELIDIQDQGIKEGIKSAATYRFMAKYNNVAFNDDLDKEQERFNNRASKRGGMALLFPKNYEEIKQIDSKPFVIDAEQMKQIQTNVFNYFGVNESVLQNKTYGDEWTAFYEGAVEPFAIQFSEVMTAMFVACGNLSGDCGIMATSNRLQYMSNKEKLDFSVQLSDRGALNRDEMREMWNLPALPNGEGQEYIIRGEYWNAKEKINEGENQDA